MRLNSKSFALGTLMVTAGWLATGCGGGGGSSPTSTSSQNTPTTQTASVSVVLPAAGAPNTNGLNIVGSTSKFVVHVVDPTTFIDVLTPTVLTSTGSANQSLTVTAPSSGGTLLITALNAKGQEIGWGTTTVSAANQAASSNHLRQSAPGSVQASSPVNLVAPVFNDSGTWVAQGPGPLFDNTGELQANVSGRIVASMTNPLNPNEMYVGTATSGVYKSSDGGTSWAPKTDSLPVLTTGALTLDPNDATFQTLLWGTGESNDNGIAGKGIYKSTDGGATWNQLAGSAGFAHRGVSRVAVQPGNANVILAGVVYVPGSNFAGSYNVSDGNYGPFLSTDGGTTFTNVLTTLLGSPTNAPCTDVAFSPINPSTTMFAGVEEDVVQGTQGNAGIYRSTDSGATWTHLTIKNGGGTTLVANTAISRVRFATKKVGTTEYLYALVSGLIDINGNQTFQGVYLTQDDGNTWVAVSTTPTLASQTGNQAAYDAAIAVDPNSPTTVYVGGVEVVRLDNINTTTGAATLVNLTPQNFGDTTHPHTDNHDLLALKVNTNQTLLRVTTDGGIWQLNNAAVATLSTPWNNLNGSQTAGHIESLQMYGLALDPTNFLHAWAGMQDNGSAVFTNNRRWIGVQGGDGGYPRVDTKNPQRVFLAFQDGQIERYLDGGLSYNKAVQIGTGINANDPREFVTPYILHPTSQGTMAYGTNQVYESSNYGDSFTQTSGGPLNGNVTITTLAYHPTNPATLYAGLYNGQVFVRTAGSSTFTGNTVLTNARINALAVDGDDATGRTAYAAVSLMGAPGQKVFETTDAGATWTDISTGLPDGPATALYLDASVAPKRLFVGTEAGQVYSRPVSGGSFTAFGTGLLPVEITGIERSGHVLAISTYGRGMFEMPMTVGEGTVPAAVVSGNPPSGPYQVAKRTPLGSRHAHARR